MSESQPPPVENPVGKVDPAKADAAPLGAAARAAAGASAVAGDLARLAPATGTDAVQGVELEKILPWSVLPLVGIIWFLVVAPALTEAAKGHFVTHSADAILILVAACLVVGASAFQYWRLQVGPHARWVALQLGRLDTKGRVFRRHPSRPFWLQLGALAVGILLALAFGYQIHDPYYFGVALSWALALGTGTAMVLATLDTLGGESAWPVVGGHPDGVGGLKPLGTFAVTAVVPLLLGSAVLAGVAMDPLDATGGAGLYKLSAWGAFRSPDPAAVEANARKQDEHLAMEKFVDGMCDKATGLDDFTTCSARRLDLLSRHRLTERHLCAPLVVAFARISLLFGIVATLLTLWLGLRGGRAALKVHNEALEKAMHRLQQESARIVLRLDEANSVPDGRDTWRLKKVREAVAELEAQRVGTWPLPMGSVASLLAPQLLAVAGSLWAALSGVVHV